MSQRCGGRFSTIGWCKRPTQAFRWNLCGGGVGGGWLEILFFLSVLYITNFP